MLRIVIDKENTCSDNKKKMPTKLLLIYSRKYINLGV